MNLFFVLLSSVSSLIYFRHSSNKSYSFNKSSSVIEIIVTLCDNYYPFLDIKDVHSSLSGKAHLFLNDQWLLYFKILL